jgi:quercetin dioxygenase-like cupin family protein
MNERSVNMETKLTEIAERIRALREICGFSAEEMAAATNLSTEQYAELESGTKDFSFTFLYLCAEKFGVDMVELLTGENPHLTGYTVVRSGKGLPIKRREGFEYNHLAAHFRTKFAEPFLVKAPYFEAAQSQPIATSVHEGQEFDYVISGTMKFAHDGHFEILNAGDSVYYDSGTPHGMIAVGGGDCLFLAVVIKGEGKS